MRHLVIIKEQKVKELHTWKESKHDDLANHDRDGGEKYISDSTQSFKFIQVSMFILKIYAVS